MKEGESGGEKLSTEMEMVKGEMEATTGLIGRIGNSPWARRLIFAMTIFSSAAIFEVKPNEAKAADRLGQGLGVVLEIYRTERVIVGGRESRERIEMGRQQSEERIRLGGQQAELDRQRAYNEAQLKLSENQLKAELARIKAQETSELARIKGEEARQVNMAKTQERVEEIRAASQARQVEIAAASQERQAQINADLAKTQGALQTPNPKDVRVQAPNEKGESSVTYGQKQQF